VPSIADIVREHGGAYVARFGPGLLPSHRRALADIAGCRTPAMGGHLLDCADCGHREYVYHSCRNRACPQCHQQRTEEWLAQRARELLPVRYHHLVLTLPAELREAARSRQQAVLGALMQAAAAAVQALARDPKYAGGRIGILAVLHTWTRALAWHPHVHCLVPGIALAPDREVLHPAERFLLPVRALSVIFRARMAASLRALEPPVQLPAAVWRKPWVAFARPCVEGAEGVLQYLARYAFRGPLSNRHLVGTEGGRVTFRYTDNRTGKPRSITVSGEEFLRRYLQHVLPKGFQRVRYYGLWSPSSRQTLRALQLLLAPSQQQSTLPALLAKSPRPVRPACCPRCGSAHWHLVGRFLPAAPCCPMSPTRGPPP